MNGSTKGGKESAARSANLGGCKGRAANEDRRQTKRTAFAAQKDAPNGKKTMKAFLWSLEKAAYDQEHNG